MSLTVAEAISRLGEAIPLSAAADWDPVGFQVGDPGARAERVAVCHEVTAAVVEAAADAGTGLLVAYHPLLFSPTTEFTAGGAAPGRAFALAQAGIALYVVHTAFDVAPEGVAAALADALGLGEVTGFGTITTRNAIFADSHVGRIGVLEPPVRLATFVANAIDDTLGAAARVAGELDRTVRRVAVVPGSGGDFIRAAAEAGADVIVTGDVSHHRARDGLAHGIAVVDAGHVATERPGVARLYSLVSQMFDEVTDLTYMDPSPWETG